MLFVVWSTLICCLCTALIARGPYVISAVLFVIANAAYQAGLQYYDAMAWSPDSPPSPGRFCGV